MHGRWLTAATTAALVLAGPADAGEARAFENARLIPIDGPEIERGTLVVANGRIESLGPTGQLSLPTGAERIDCAGKVIMPGLVDTHSHLGGPGAGDGSHPLNPGVRVLDSINVLDSSFRRALAGGLTTLNIMSGSGHLLSGQTIYVKLRAGRTIEELMYRFPDGAPMGGIKMANGTNPQDDPPFPGTRGKAAALVRQMWIDAIAYGEKLERAGDDPDKRPERDLGKEALLEALSGRKIVHHHTHRHDDIMTILRLKQEFGFRVVLHHVSEGWKVADEIAAAEVPCSIILVDSPGGKLEAIDLVFRTGGVLEQAGVNVAFHTDDWITDSRLFFRSAALGVRAGMTRTTALRALTLAGAEMMDLEDRIGSLTRGKDADFIVLDGDPLSTYTKVLETWVQGEKVYDRSDPDDHLHAVGGWGANADVEPYFCCFEHEGRGQ